MKTLVLFLYSTFYILHFAFAQGPLAKQWDESFGGTKDDLLGGIKQTHDSCLILWGSSASGVDGNKSSPSLGETDVWLVKTDLNGVKLWEKVYGTNQFDYADAMDVCADGGFIIGCSSNVGINGDKTMPTKGGYDYWILKLDSAGNKQWDKDFGGTGDDGILCIRQTSDKGYLLGGYSHSGIGGDKSDSCRGDFDYWVVKIDSSGNKQWDKTFGGMYFDVLYDARQTKDGGYILGGYSSSGISIDKSEPCHGLPDYWIVKIDSLGNKQWDRTFGSYANNIFSCVALSDDGGYLLTGSSDYGINGDKTQYGNGGYDFWVVKTDSAGNKLWDKSYGGSGHEDDLQTTERTSDGGYLIAGTSYSQISGDKTEDNLMAEQTWVIKINSWGMKQWDKTLHTQNFQRKHDEVGYAIQLYDGCFVFANYTNGINLGDKTDDNPDWTQKTADYWMIKYCDTSSVAVPLSNFISSDSSICDEFHNCINFYDHSLNNPTSWKWRFPGAFPDSSDQQNPSGICYYTTGTYAVTLVVANAAGSDTLTVSPMITVGATPPAPVITVISGDTLICSHSSSYQWFFNGSAIPAATDSFYIAMQAGSYNVQITDSIGCTRLGSSVLASVSEFEQDAGFWVYPNPVGNELNVMCAECRGKEVMGIYNVLGELIYNSLPSPVPRPFSIDVSSLPKGVYVVQMVEGDKVYRSKFVKD